MPDVYIRLVRRLDKIPVKIERAAGETDQIAERPRHLESPNRSVCDQRGSSMRYASVVCIIAAVLSATPVSASTSSYDGSWSLVFTTERGACDPSYNFNVNIARGIVTEPNLVKFRGRVAPNGMVRASVTVQDKYAAGSGRLTRFSGRGTWSGHSGGAQCSGYWTGTRL